MDPQHFLYGKINQFLNNGPSWDLDKIPLLHSILIREPDGDRTYYKEVEWLLDTLDAGLRWRKVCLDVHLIVHSCEEKKEADWHAIT